AALGVVAAVIACCPGASSIGAFCCVVGVDEKACAVVGFGAPASWSPTGTSPGGRGGIGTRSTLWRQMSMNCCDVSLSTPPGNCFLMSSGTLPQMAFFAHASPFCRPSAVFAIFCQAGAPGLAM